MIPAVIAAGFACVGVLGAIYYVTYMRLLHRQDRDALVIAAHTQQLAELASKVDALTDWLGVDVHAEDIDPDRAEQEDTDEIPVVQPDTEPMAVTTVTPAVAARRDAAWQAAADELAETHTVYVNIGGQLTPFEIPRRTS